MVWVGFVAAGGEMFEVTKGERVHIGRQDTPEWESWWVEDKRQDNDGVQHLRRYVAAPRPETSKVALVVGHEDSVRTDGNVDIHALLICRQKGGRMLLHDRNGNRRAHLRTGERTVVRVPMHVEVWAAGAMVCEVMVAARKDNLETMLKQLRQARGDEVALREVLPLVPGATQPLAEPWVVKDVIAGDPRSTRYLLLLAASLLSANTSAGRYGHVVSSKEVLAAVNKHLEAIGWRPTNSAGLLADYRRIITSEIDIGDTDRSNIAHRTATLALDRGFVNDQDIRDFRNAWEKKFGMSLLALSRSKRGNGDPQQVNGQTAGA